MTQPATSTPGHDGTAKTNNDGTVDTGGRTAFVWCQDAETGHRYDVLSTRLPRKGVNPVDGYPLNYKRFGRPAKTRQQWESSGDEPAGQSTAQPSDADTPTPPGEQLADEPGATTQPANQANAAPDGDDAPTADPADAGSDAATEPAGTSTGRSAKRSAR